MNDDQPRHGPDPEALRRFLPTMKKFVDGKMAELPSGKPKGKTVVGKHSAQPISFCPICQAMSKEKHPVGVEIPLKEKDCAECRAELEQGKIALISPDGRYAFVFNDKLAGVLEQARLDAAAAGKALPPVDRTCIGNSEMNLLEAHVKANREKQEGEQDV